MASYADSTIGMTAYNVIAMHSNPTAFDDICTVACRLQHADLDREQMQRALDELVARKRVTVVDGIYDLVASDRLMVVQRDLGDYNPRTMEGGWEAWRVKDPRVRDGVGTRPIESLIGLPPTDRVPRPLNMSGDMR